MCAQDNIIGEKKEEDTTQGILNYENKIKLFLRIKTFFEGLDFLNRFFLELINYRSKKFSYSITDLLKFGSENKRKAWPEPIA